MAQAIIVENAQETNRRQHAREADKTKTASEGVSMFFGARYTGNMIGSILVIYLLEESNRQGYMFGTSFVPVLLFIIALILPEKKKVQGQVVITDKASETVEMKLYNIEKALETPDEHSENKNKPISNFEKDPNLHKEPCDIQINTTNVP